MKHAILSLFMVIIGLTAYAASGNKVTVTGRLKSLEKESFVIETEDATVSVNRKFLKKKASVGERVSIEMPEEEFKNLKIVPLKK